MKDNDKGMSALGCGLVWFGAAVSIAEIEAGAAIAPAFHGQGGYMAPLAALLAGPLLGGAMLFLAALLGARTRRSAMDCVKAPFGRIGGGFFAAMNLPMPKPIPLMPLSFQIAQKLHGASQPGSSRVRDLIDLQLIAQNETIDFARTADICRRLFAYRKAHVWPPQIEKGDLWSEVYSTQRGTLPVLPTVDEAIAWANDLITRIDKA